MTRQGDGPKPGPTDKVRINYRGKLINGTEFDSSYKRGKPAEFPVNGVIKGFGEGLQLMPVGSEYKLYIPGDLAYGATARPGIPPNSTLIFEVELLGIVKEGEMGSASQPASQPAMKPATQPAKMGK